MKLLYSYIRRLCAYITDRLYQFKRFLLLSIDGLGLSCPVFTKVTGILPVALVCFHFVCFAQESRESGATGIGEENNILTKGHVIKPYHRKNIIENVKINPRFDIEKYPMVVYDINEDNLIQVSIGDTISKEIMEMPLWVVGKDVLSDTIRLCDISKDKLLIIDFWTTWCGPCVDSMDEWEKVQSELGDDVVLLGAHMSFDYYAQPFINKKKWQSKSIIGLNAWVLNRCFFNPMMISRAIWIKDGRLLAITGTKPIDINIIKDVIKGEQVDLPMIFDASYTSKQS